MTSITVIVRRLEPDGTLRLIPVQRPRLVEAPEETPHEPESYETLAERVFLFLDQRSA